MLLRNTLILASAMAGLLAAPAAVASPVKPLTAKQTALIMRLNRAHKGQTGAEHASDNTGLIVAGVGVVAGVAVGLGTTGHNASGG